jgi:hypothetical protein
MWGTAATSDELTGNFGRALEDTSIGDCRLVALFAEKTLRAIFGVLQHNRHLRDLPTGSDSVFTRQTAGECGRNGALGMDQVEGRFMQALVVRIRCGGVTWHSPTGA